ncbi:MAG: hypothetical protein ABIJ05_04000 [Patescibacteria group bacterium]
MMFITFNLIGIFIFLFLFWKRMKDDYLPNQIFSTFFYILFFMLVFYFISINLFTSWWFWFTYLGFTLGLVLGILRFKLKFYETYEAAFLGFLICFSMYLLGDSVRNLNIDSFVGFVISMLLIGIFHFIDANYKNFSWYKSGKVGFTGLILLAIFFLTRALAYIFFPNTLSFVPNYEIYFSSISSFIFLALTYNLSRS